MIKLFINECDHQNVHHHNHQSSSSSQSSWSSLLSWPSSSWSSSLVPPDDMDPGISQAGIHTWQLVSSNTVRWWRMAHKIDESCLSICLLNRVNTVNHSFTSRNSPHTHRHILYVSLKECTYVGTLYVPFGEFLLYSETSTSRATHIWSKLESMPFYEESIDALEGFRVLQ